MHPQTCADRIRIGNTKNVALSLTEKKTEQQKHAGLCRREFVNARAGPTPLPARASNTYHYVPNYTRVNELAGVLTGQCRLTRQTQKLNGETVRGFAATRLRRGACAARLIGQLFAQPAHKPIVYSTVC